MIVLRPGRRMRSVPGMTQSWNLAELPWAAGFFDGEGSTYFTTSGSRMYPTVRAEIAQNDPRPLLRFQAALGFGSMVGPRSRTSPTQNDYYRWRSTSFQAAQQSLACLWPWLSEPKREQAIRVLRRYKDVHREEARTQTKPERQIP